MHEIEGWIEDAIRESRLNATKLSPELAKVVVGDATSRFVRGQPRAWWMSLAVECDRVSSEGLPLSAVIPPGALEAYLIPETEEDELPAYRVPVAELDQLVGSCPFFEYYVGGADSRWLVIESDHNEYYLCGGARMGVQTVMNE